MGMAFFYLVEYFSAKRVKSAAKVLPFFLLEYAKRLRHNSFARSSLIRPSALIPFPFGYEPALPMAFFFPFFF
jgi:hypothetical protein